MKRISVLFQLVVVLIVILIIPVSTITYYTGKQMMNKTTDEITTSTMEKTEYSKELNELMLSNVIQDTLVVVNSDSLKNYQNITSYEELNSSHSNVKNAMSVLNTISEVETKNDCIFSIVFYPDNADYIISTNKGIVTLEEYEDITWLNRAVKQINGAEGIWYPRVLNKLTVKEIEKNTMQEDTLNVISYVYRISRLSSSLKGTLAINVYEDAISSKLNTKSESNESNGYIIDSEGDIITNEDKTKLYTKVSSTIQDNLTGKVGSFQTVEGDKTFINTYIKSDFYDWTYISKYSLSDLMQSTNSLWKRSIVFTIVIIAVGILLTIIFAGIFYKPMRTLVNDLQKANGIQMKKKGNEIAFMQNAFQQIQSKQQEFHELIRQHENETKILLLYNLIEGNEISEIAKKEVQEIFTHPHFIVAIIAVDNTMKYIGETSHDVRKFQRYKLFDSIKETFLTGYTIECIRYNRTMTAVIFNIKEYDAGEVRNALRDGLKVVSKDAKSIIGSTVTIGVGQVHTGYEKIADCAYEAMQALKRRFTEGQNNIFFWSPKQTENYVYYSFYNNEKKIINYLDTKDYESLEKELDSLLTIMKNSKNISHENILMVFYQLIGSTIKYMVEHTINTAKIIGTKESIYSIISNLDTVDEINTYIKNTYHALIEYMKTEDDSCDVNYCNQCIKYLMEHYKEEVIYEELAERIGISYSYLRRIVKEQTGKSLIDNMNSIRIEEVKRMLLYTNMSISDIAGEVGYHNVQSMSRFFKKFEGISPSEFKMAKQ